MDSENPLKPFFEGFFLVLFIYVLYEIAMWYFDRQSKNDEYGPSKPNLLSGSCGCGKKKSMPIGNGKMVDYNDLPPSRKACIALDMCHAYGIPLSEIAPWKVAIIRDAHKIFGKDKSKPTPKSKRRK